jgi:hypothetical protein
MNGNFVIAVEWPRSGAFPGRLATICEFAGANPPSRLYIVSTSVPLTVMLAEGENTETIAEKLHGDEQLVRMWISLLLHNH